MKIGVTGATGHLGRLTIQKLKERTSAENVIALVRDVHKASDLGVESRVFDYSDPEILPESLKGVDVVFLISGNEIGKREAQHRNVIEASVKAGVKWIIYTSLLKADTSSLSLAPEHLATEKMLKDSGIEYTVLRNGWYTENYTVSIHGALKAGAFVGAAGDGMISSAAREDYAKAAANVLTSEGHRGKTYELSGDHAYTLTDLAAEISKQTGKHIPYQNLSEPAYAAVLVQAGLPEGLANAIAGWDISASKGDLYDAGTTLHEILKRDTVPMAVSVSEALI